MIRTILASKTHNPHYLNKYIRFITNCQAQNENYTGYTEQHHICPRAKDMFPEYDSFANNPWNCARLTTRQHYIAHKLLLKVFPSIASIAHTMRFYNKYSHSSKQYELLVGDKSLTAIYKDMDNNIVCALRTDSRVISGELVGHTKGKMVAKGLDGTAVQVDTNDSRLLSGELVSVSKGMIAVKDTQGSTYWVSNKDSRFLSGELVHVTKGKPAWNRKIDEDIVKEIRLALKVKDVIFDKNFLLEVLHADDIDKLTTSTITDLRFKSLRKVKYIRLLMLYYTYKYNICNRVVLRILNNETYKEIIV